MLRSIGRLGAGACKICEQPEQENFGRTYRMTLNCSGTRSRISLTSSPRYRSLPPQLGQGLSAGTGGCDTVSRGRLLGKGLRTGLPLTGWGDSIEGSSCTWVASSSSIESSSWLIRSSSCSEERP